MCCVLYKHIHIHTLGNTILWGECEATGMLIITDRYRQVITISVICSAFIC